MKTDDLISLLAADTAPVPRHAASRQIAIAMAVGIPLAILTMLLTMGSRPDLAQAIQFPLFWVKVLFPAAVACAGFATLARLARPGVSTRAGMLTSVLPILLLWLLALAAYAGVLSGAAGAAVYAFHCPETASPFMAIWYVTPS